VTARGQTVWVIYAGKVLCQTRRMPPKPEIRIRSYRPGDRDPVMQLAPRLTEGIAPWRDPADMLRSIQTAIRMSIDGFRVPGRAVFVAAAGKEIVGMVTVSERIDFTGQREAYVGWLAVHAGMVRRGIATRLMGAAESWAAARGLACITLETGAANDPARSLYSSLGYEEEDIRFTKHSLQRKPR
jgi:ribosomal protein S18 acetylase RimI-like enzyme